MADKTRRTGDLVSDNNIFVDIVNDRVGIGTTVATAQLTVAGDINLTAGIITATSGIVTYYGDGQYLQNITSSGGISSISISSNVENQSQYITYATSIGNTTGLGVTTGGLTFNPSTGRMGIGAASPEVDLHILSGTSSFSPVTNFDKLVIENQNGGQGAVLQLVSPNVSEIGFSDATRNAGLLSYNHNTNSIHFDSNNVARATIDSNGNLGIGTNDPSGRFQVDDIFTITETDNIFNPAPAFVVKGATDTIMEIGDDDVHISKPLNLSSTLFSRGGITATGSLTVEIDNTVDISYVGGTSINTGNSITLTGIESGDLVLFFSAADSDNQATPSSGWTAIPGLGTQPDNDGNPDSAAFYKFSEGTSLTASGLNDNDTTAMLIAFRGVNSDQPFSVNSVESTGTSGMPNPPSITTVDDECMIVAVGLIDDDQFVGTQAPSGYSLAISEYGNSCTIMSAYKAQTSAGSENPGAFSGAGDDFYKAQTIALKVDRRVRPGFTVNNFANVTAANVNATTFIGSGSGLTNLPAGELSGTLASVDGSNITSLDASNLGSGTVPNGRFPATLPAVSGANLTSLNGTNIASGTVAAARVATLNQNTTGTADNFTVTANNSTDETVYPVFVDGATGSQGAETSSNLTYNPSSRTLDIQGSFKVQDDIFDDDTPSFVINKTTSSDLVFKTDNNAVNIGAGISCTILDDAYIGVSNSKGLILTSPNGTQYRLIVANDGTLSTSSV